MNKQSHSAIITLSLFCFFIFPAILLADETLTITTYYPSPYGSYNELTTASNTYLATSSGRVGIGTTSPGIIFEAMNNGASDPIGRFRRNSSEYIDIGVDAQATNWKGAIWYDGTKQIEFYNRGIALGTYSDLTGANQIPAGGAIIPGNVGIGTTSPSAKFHLVDTTAGNNFIQFVEGSSANENRKGGFRNLAVGTDDDRVGLAIGGGDGSSYNRIWADNSGILRITSIDPASHINGNIIGEQQSALSQKNLIGEFTSYSDALGAIVNAPLYRFTYKNHAYNDEEFVGIITDYSPVFGKDRSEEFPNGRHLNEVTGFGYTFAAIKELDSRTKSIGTTGQGDVTIDGNVGIGTTSPGGKLDVNGTIYQRGSVLHADYVFEPDYNLESIEEHSQYMWQNKHLKAVPRAQKDEGK